MTHLDLMHGSDYAGQDVTGWFAQEKLDGWRALWTGTRLITRQGNSRAAPGWFTRGLPTGTPLDCELWTYHGGANEVTSRVKSAKWNDLRLVIFDAPGVIGGYAARHDFARRFLATTPLHIRIADRWTVDEPQCLNAELAEVQSRGGEGLMLRAPLAHYTAGRVETLLKFKTPFQFGNPQTVSEPLLQTA